MMDLKIEQHHLDRILSGEKTKEFRLLDEKLSKSLEEDSQINLLSEGESLAIQFISAEIEPLAKHLSDFLLTRKDVMNDIFGTVDIDEIYSLIMSYYPEAKLSDEFAILRFKRLDIPSQEVTITFNFDETLEETLTLDKLNETIGTDYVKAEEIRSEDVIQYFLENSEDITLNNKMWAYKQNKKEDSTQVKVNGEIIPWNS